MLRVHTAHSGCDDEEPSFSLRTTLQHKVVIVPFFCKINSWAASKDLIMTVKTSCVVILGFGSGGKNMCLFM
jgi:hypothetical protein